MNREICLKCKNKHLILEHTILMLIGENSPYVKIKLNCLNKSELVSDEELYKILKDISYPLIYNYKYDEVMIYNGEVLNDSEYIRKYIKEFYKNIIFDGCEYKFEQELNSIYKKESEK